MVSEGMSNQKASESGGDAWIGKVVGGRYRLDVLLGSGSMGRVYRAEHVLLHKPLAVKLLNAEHTRSPELVARFEREATAAANIDHPNVAAATDFGKLDDGTPYLALELVEGKNLRAEVAGGPLEARRALHIARQIAAGLAAAHARSIVHRDLKPENVVLVPKDGDPDFVKVLDFGVAKLAPESGKSPLTKVGAVLGTLDYMAPEQALGQEVDSRADLYALGAVLYEMLSGVCPYDGESSSEMLVRKLKNPPPSLRERAPTLAIPGAVEVLVMKLLAKDRKDRPVSAAVVASELERLVAQSPKGAAKPVAAPPRPASTRPVQNKPTFLPTDPLPSFTFPPLEEESKKLAEEVKQAVSAKQRVLSSSPSVDALLANLPASQKPDARPPLSPVSSSPSVDALLANLPAAGAPQPSAPPATPASNSGSPAAKPDAFRELRARAGEALEAAIVWVDDRRRFLPRFIKRPLRRVPSGALLAGVLVLGAVLVVALVSWAGSTAAPPAGG
jgi:serine/threonine protein kinase